MFIRVPRSGFGVVQVLVAFALLGFFAMAMNSLLGQQGKASQSLDQKIDILDLKRVLVLTFSNPLNCNCQLNPSGGPKPTFDRTSPNATINLTTVYQGCDATGLPVGPIVTSGSILPGSTGKLKVSQIAIKNVNQVGAATPNDYIGDLEISFSNSTGAKAPISIKQLFTIDPLSASASTTIDHCAGSASTPPTGSASAPLNSTAGSYFQVWHAGGWWTCPFPNATTGTCSCPTGYTAHQSWAFDNPGGFSGFYCITGMTSGCKARTMLCTNP
jgi:hypothetical protein